MADNRSYKIRPTQTGKGSRTDPKEIFWIYLSPRILLLHGLGPGDICHLNNTQGSVGLAIVYDNPKIQDSVVQVSETLRTIYGLLLGDSVSLSKLLGPVTTVENVVLEEVLKDQGIDTPVEKDRSHWAWVAEDAFRRAKYLCAGMVIEVEAIHQRKSFKATSVNGSADPEMCHFIADMEVEIVIEGLEERRQTRSEPADLELANELIAGLDCQIVEINHRLKAYYDSREKIRFPTNLPVRQGGILIHGPTGTGKTYLVQSRLSGDIWNHSLTVHRLLLDHIAKIGRANVFRLEVSGKGQAENEKNLRQTFAEARRHQPSIVLIDGLEDICRKAQAQYSLPNVDLTKALCTEIDSLSNARVFLIAATNSLSNVNDKLRTPRRFRIELETTVPDSRARTEILNIISGLPKDADSPELHKMGERTHGYVGTDLLKLYARAVDKADDRFFASRSRNAAKEINGTAEIDMDITITEDDLNTAFLEIRPTAMREVFLETPKVKWSDIGGQDEVKNSLQEAIEWPFKVCNVATRLYRLD